MTEQMKPTKCNNMILFLAKTFPHSFVITRDNMQATRFCASTTFFIIHFSYYTCIMIRCRVWWASLAPALRYSFNRSLRAPRGARLNTRHSGWRLMPSRGTIFVCCSASRMLSSLRAFRYASHAFFIGSLSQRFFSA